LFCAYSLDGSRSARQVEGKRGGTRVSSYGHGRYRRTTHSIQRQLQLHGTSTLESGNSLEGSTRVEVVHCSRVRLDTAITEPVGLIKIDVEGHEVAVLRGATQLIERDRPVLIVESAKTSLSRGLEYVIAFLMERCYAGMFLLNGLPQSITSFRTQIHQPRENIQNVSKVGTYVNNFIFFPG